MLSDIADEIYRELGEPDELSVAAIAFWLQSNIGQLNILLNINPLVIVDEGSGEFSPNLTEEQKEIYKHKYLVNYFTRLIKTSLGAAAYDWSEVQEGDSSVRRVSRNEIAKTYQQVRNALQTELTDLIFYYKQNRTIPYSLTSVNNLFLFYRQEV